MSFGSVTKVTVAVRRDGRRVAWQPVEKRDWWKSKTAAIMDF